jgi:hypothetical protein
VSASDDRIPAGDLGLEAEQFGTELPVVPSSLNDAVAA